MNRSAPGRRGPAPATGAVALVPRPPHGRLFDHRARTVRLGDVSPGGRLRLDAVARYLQDVATDDIAAAGLPGGGAGGGTAWVVRRTLIEVPVPITYRERVDVTTWCSATGARWAERRTTLAGTEGGFVEAVSLWVHVDLRSGRPARLDARFGAVYGPAAAGRQVRATLTHDDPGPGARRSPLSLRFADFDVMGHVNNAVYWALVEDHLAGGGWAGRVRASVEHRGGIGPGDEAEVAVDVGSAAVRLWWAVGDVIRASAVVEPCPV